MTRTYEQTITIKHVIQGDDQTDFEACTLAITNHTIDILVDRMKLDLKAADIGSTFKHLEDLK